MPDIQVTGPQEWALNVLDSQGWRDTTVCMPWGRGSGKSWFVRFMLWLSVAKNYGVLRSDALKPFTGVRILGLCPTLKQLRDIHGAALETENSTDWHQLGGKINKSTLRIEFPDGSWFMPMPAQNASSKAARGQRADIVWVDECDDIPLEVFLAVVKPWLSEPWSFHLVFASGTPRLGRHGLLYHLHSLGKENGDRFGLVA